MPYLVASYVDIQDSSAGPANTWFAQSSVDSGNNNGWLITSGGVFEVYYTQIQDGLVLYPSIGLAPVTEGNVNAGRNAGWIFTNSPSAQTGAMALFTS